MDDRTYHPSTYGDRIAGIYDELYGAMSDVGSMVSMLAGFARGGRALELGIGTGRVALPLAAKGVRVSGVDSSQAMVSQLRAKPGGDAIEVSIGDFSETPVAGTCSLVFVVFNTLFCLPSQEAQIRCFKNVAAHLAPGGVFLVEAFVPNLTRFALGQSTQTTHVGTDRVRLDVSRHDPVAQTITSQQVHISESGVKLYPLQLRYAWPSELDLMAQLAGLRLRHRVGGWQREPFTAESGHHVSMYEKL